MPEVARANGLEIEFTHKKNFRKEERIQKIVARHGHHPSLVYILSAFQISERRTCFLRQNLPFTRNFHPRAVYLLGDGTV